MHIIEAFGRIFISLLFIFEAFKKFSLKEETIFYMTDYGVSEILFYPALLFEMIFPVMLIIGYKTKISAFAMFIFTIVVTIVFHSNFSDQIQLMVFLKNLAIAGGFLIISANEPKVFTLDYYLKNK